MGLVEKRKRHEETKRGFWGKVMRGEEQRDYGRTVGKGRRRKWAICDGKKGTQRAARTVKGRVSQ